MYLFVYCITYAYVSMGHVHMDFESFHALLKLLNKINKNKSNRKISKLVVLAEMKATLNIFQNFLPVQIIVPMRQRMDFCGTGHSWVNKF